jgi:hypothetical protein
MSLVIASGRPVGALPPGPPVTAAAPAGGSALCEKPNYDITVLILRNVDKIVVSMKGAQRRTARFWPESAHE